MVKTQSQRLTELENQIAALQAENTVLKQEVTDVKNAQRILARAIHDLSTPQPSFIAQVNKSRQ